MGVVAFHSRLSEYFTWYWGSMDFFFVLSGFLITRSMLDIRRRDGGLGMFLTYRMVRLLPVYVLFVICAELFITLANQGWLMAAWRGKVAGGFSLYLLTFTQNLDLLVSTHEIFPRGFGLDHFWSLILEEHYYLVWGLIFFFSRACAVMQQPKIMLALVALLMTCSMSIRWLGYSWWLLPARLDGFVVGTFMGLIRFRPGMPAMASLIKRPVGVLLMVAAGFYLIQFASKHADLLRNQSQNDGQAWLAVSSFVVLSAFLINYLYDLDLQRTGRGQFARIFSWVGLISYELYVVHGPVIILLTQKDVSEQLTGLANSSGPVLFPVVLVCSLAVAWVLHTYITKPCMARRKQIYEVLRHALADVVRPRREGA